MIGWVRGYLVKKAAQSLMKRFSGMRDFGAILQFTARAFGMFREPTHTAQKVKFFIKDFFSKCDQIRSFLRIWSHLLKKSVMENFIFCAVSKLWMNVFLISQLSLSNNTAKHTHNVRYCLIGVKPFATMVSPKSKKKSC